MLYYFIINFYQNIVALKCCVNFCFAANRVSYIYKHASPSFWISFPFRSPQSTEQSSLYYSVVSDQLSILHIVSMYLCQSQSPSSSHPPLPPLCPCVPSLLLRLCCCPGIILFLEREALKKNKTHSFKHRDSS